MIAPPQVDKLSKIVAGFQRRMDPKKVAETAMEVLVAFCRHHITVFSLF